MNSLDIWLISSILSIAKAENRGKKLSASLIYKLHKKKNLLKDNMSYRDIEKLIEGEQLSQISYTLKYLKEEGLIDKKNNTKFIYKKINLTKNCQSWLFDALKLLNSTKYESGKARVIYNLALHSKKCRLLIRNKTLQELSKVSYMTLYNALKLLEENRLIELKDDIILLKKAIND